MLKRSFKQHVDSNSCLVVASGPSAKRVNELNTYGHIATLNRTISLVEGLVDYAIFQDVETLKPVLDHLHKCCYLIVPEKLHEKGGKIKKGGAVIPLNEISWLPDNIRALVYPYRIPKLKNIAKVIHERRVPFFSGGCIILFIVASLGFQDMFCLGFDGGLSNFDSANSYSYERHHERDKFVASIISQEFEVGIHFWVENIGEFVEYSAGSHESSNLSS